jgi:hypothetical protein
MLRQGSEFRFHIGAGGGFSYGVVANLSVDLSSILRDGPCEAAMYGRSYRTAVLAHMAVCRAHLATITSLADPPAPLPVPSHRRTYGLIAASHANHLDRLAAVSLGLAVAIWCLHGTLMSSSRTAARGSGISDRSVRSSGIMGESVLGCGPLCWRERRKSRARNRQISQLQRNGNHTGGWRTCR